MNAIQRLKWYLSAQRRARQFGFRFVRRKSFDVPCVFRVGDRRVAVVCPPENGTRVDFINVFLDDTYRLERIASMDSNVDVIVDIGSNCGWFALAARTYFPRAMLQLYEPNEALHDILRNNTADICAEIHGCAVGGRRELVSMQVGSESNLGRTVSGGRIVQVSLQDVLEKVGGRIDLLKLDCEGAEWPILESKVDWPAIRWLTLEYHLWAKPNSSHQTPIEALGVLGFRVLAQACDTTCGTLLAVNTRPLRGGVS